VPPKTVTTTYSANQTYGNWHNDDIQHNDIYHKDTVGSAAMLSVSYAKDGQFIYAECREVHSTIVGKKYSLSLYRCQVSQRDTEVTKANEVYLLYICGSTDLNFS
jgi:hypothetical protein